MRTSTLAVATLAAVPAFAHGEQVLVFPISLALLLFVAVAIVVAPWHRWWGRVIAATVLLASNVALWFLPFASEPLFQLAVRSMPQAVAILLAVPVVLTGAVMAVMVWKRRAAHED